LPLLGGEGMTRCCETCKWFMPMSVTITPDGLERTIGVCHYLDRHIGKDGTIYRSWIVQSAPECWVWQAKESTSE
jgi:hypothetical protein